MIIRFGGIDVGSLSAQAVILENGSIRAYTSMPVKNNPLDSATTVLFMALEMAGLEKGDLSFTVSTGYGREQIQKEGLSQANVSEISAHGKGAHWLLPAVHTVIDIGGQDAKVIRVDQAGELVDFVMNDKCAAGTGRFLEVMARTLGVTLEELGPLSFKAHNPIELSTRCSIYCETEVLHYMQRGVDSADIAASVNRTMAERVLALVRRVGVDKEVTMTGGVAKNVAVRKELERLVGARLVEYDVDSQIVGALGAALIAKEQGGGR